MPTSAQPVSAPFAASGPRGDAPGQAIIRTVELSKTYPGNSAPAVDRLNLEVMPGEIFGLLGPNGAGKTTTAGMLSTRVMPTSGRAFIGDVDVIAHPALAKQLISIVSQQNTLDRALTVWENLYFHGLLFGIPAKRSKTTADQLLDRFQLGSWGDRSVYALSGGMAQRLMVARAIFHRPAVLFLDEPTAGLDPQSRLALWEILQGLNADGQTILLTTHYMEEAEQLCARVAIMDHGRVLALDTPDALRSGVDADTVLTLASSSPLDALEAALRRAIPEMTGSRHIEGGLELRAKGAERLLPRVVEAVDGAGLDLADLSVKRPNLETVFIELTGRELRD